MTRYICNPGLSICRDKEHLKLSLEPYGIGLKAPAELDRLLRVFQQPRPLSSVPGHLVEVAARLVNLMILVPEQQAQLLTRGLLMPAEGQLTPVTAPATWKDRLHAAKVAVIGLPYDTSPALGPSPKSGPVVLRHFIQASAASALNGIVDLGDVVFCPHHESAAAPGQRLQYVIAEALARESRVAIFGGDHAFTSYAVEALAAIAKPIAVLQLDGHSDLTESRDPSREVLNHCNFMRRVLALPHVRRVVQLGVRDNSAVNAPANDRLSGANKLVRFTSQPAHISDVLDALDMDCIIYISCDIDVLDPLEAPGVSCPLPGGLELSFVLDVVDQVARCRQLCGFDIMEVCSTFDGVEQTAKAGAAIAVRLLNAMRESSV